MSSTTTTQFYGLTQYIGTDKPDFADNNQAFRNVDADLHQVVQDSQGFTSDIADLTERVGNLDTDLTNLSGDLDGEKAKITALQNKELSQDTEISRVERNAQDMITAYNEASATSTHAYAVGDYFIYNNVLYKATAAIAVGATIVPDTNCTTTNVSSELIQIKSDLSESELIAFTYTNVNANIIDAGMIKRSGITFFEKLQCQVNTEIATAHSEVLFTLTSNTPSTEVRCSFITAQGQTYLGKISSNGDVTIDNYSGNAIVINTKLYLTGSIILG